MKATLEVINRMQADGMIGKYAIGGAVGATFYLEPSATADVDIFVMLPTAPGSSPLSVSPIYEYLRARGCRIEGERIVVGDWPVQFLPPHGALEQEALGDAVEAEVEGIRTWVLSAEHLVAIALPNRAHEGLCSYRAVPRTGCRRRGQAEWSPPRGMDWSPNGRSSSASICRSSHGRQGEAEAAGVASVFCKAENSGKVAEPQPGDCRQRAQENSSPGAKAGAKRREIQAVIGLPKLFPPPPNKIAAATSD
jgi:hypothetical protein